MLRGGAGQLGSIYRDRNWKSGKWTLMWTDEIVSMIIRGIGETLYMTVTSTLFGYVLGFPLGVVLAAAPFIARMVESSIKEV